MLGDPHVGSMEAFTSSYCKRSPSEMLNSKFVVGFFVFQKKIPQSIRNKEYFVLENEKSNIFAANLLF